MEESDLTSYLAVKECQVSPKTIKRKIAVFFITFIAELNRQLMIWWTPCATIWSFPLTYHFENIISEFNIQNYRLGGLPVNYQGFPLNSIMYSFWKYAQNVIHFSGETIGKVPRIQSELFHFHFLRDDWISVFKHAKKKSIIWNKNILFSSCGGKK